MQQYKELVEKIFNEGDERLDRTGVGTLSCFGEQLRFDLRQGFPLLTTKKVLFESVVRELLWFLSGSTNVNDLHPCKIWDAWADPRGDLGPIYGAQWRGGAAHQVDQIVDVINSLKNDPFSRRHVVSAWSVGEIKDMRLAPCHAMFQFYCTSTGYLDLQLYQRSADVALGVPFNIASYALLLHLVAKEVGRRPRYYVHTFGDVHVYKNHISGLRLQLTRELKTLPKLVLTNTSFFDTALDDVTLEGYEPHPAIKFDVAV
jgi:thymidylate synthase